MATLRSRGRISSTPWPSIAIVPPIDRLEPGDRAQDVLLPQPRRAHERGKLALRDVEIDPTHGVRCS